MSLNMEPKIKFAYRLFNGALLTRNGPLLSEESLVTTYANATQPCKRIGKKYI